MSGPTLRSPTEFAILLAYPADMIRGSAKPVPAALEVAIQQIVAVGRRLDARGLAPATSGNYSIRVADGIAITVSGSHKGRLSAADVMLVDGEGCPLDGRIPSAETALHIGLYRLHPWINAVLHVHSTAAVTLTRSEPDSGQLVLEGYEMLKAFPGVTTHETRIAVPVFDNSQDTTKLARMITTRLQQQPSPPAYLIRGHGINTWGASLDEAERVFEAFDHLLTCELQTRQLRRGA
jgi:methylthioribulose-1-phosphate dehydratase